MSNIIKKGRYRRQRRP